MAVSSVQELRSSLRIEPSPIPNLVKKIAINCLKDLAVSSALGLAVASFVPVSAGVMMMVQALFVQLAVGALFHSLSAFASYKAAQKGPRFAYFETLASLCEWITAANFAICTGFNTQSLIHETGHVLAALSVYKRPRPQIHIYPFMGGVTDFSKTSLTPFGKKIGPAAATCLIFASGPALALLVSSAILMIGLAVKQKYPQLGKYLIIWSLVDFLNQALYAHSALRTDPCNLGHDFVHLSIFGLNPRVAAVGIAAIPIVILLGMHWRQNPTSKGNPREEIGSVKTQMPF